MSVLRLLPLAVLVPYLGHAQTYVCDITATPVIVRAEGVAELVGDIVIDCKGFLSSSVLVNISVTLNTNITNRLAGSTPDGLLLINDPATPVDRVTAFNPVQLNENTVVFVGINLGAAGTGSRRFRITNFRANAAALGGSPTVPASVLAFVSIQNPPANLVLNNSTVTVGFVQTALSTAVTAPALSLCSAANQQTSEPATNPGSIRLTEQFQNAFRQRLSPGQDPSVPGTLYSGSESGFVNSTTLGSITGFATQGTRIIARFTNIPVGVTLYAGLKVGSGVLSASLAVADATGGGPFNPAPGGSFFGGAYAPLSIVAGTAFAVWEVLDSNPLQIEQLNIPFVVAYPLGAAAGTATLSVSLAPVTTVTTMSGTAPVPRFVDTGTARTAFTISTCALSANPTSLTFNAQTPGPPPPSQTITFTAPGPATITTTTASGGTWLTATIGSTSPVTVFANPAGLNPGTYTGTVRIASSGAALDVPVTLNVTCAASLSANSSPSFPAAGGTGTVTVTTGTGCTWSTTGAPPWITLQSGASGSGSGTVNYTVAANTGLASRSVNLSISGLPYTVVQDGSCTYSLNPGSANFNGNGGTGTIRVTAGNGCTWSPSPAVPWIRITSEQSGSGNGTVAYTVSANPGAAREGSIRIGSQSFSVAQGPGQTQCAVSLSPTAASFGPAGASNAALQVNASCPWTASSDSSWIRILSGGSGSLSGSLSYAVDPNTGPARTGSLSVNGTRFPVSQNGGDCVFTLGSTALTVPAAGGSRTVQLTAPSGCAWTATANVPWLQITAGGNGSLSGIVAFTIGSNAGAARTGSLLIAARVLTITQEPGSTCPVGFAPAAASYQAAGTAGASVTVNSPCAWIASSNQPWLRIVSGASGNGPGDVRYAVDPNPSASARSGAITVSGQAFAVTQLGAACEFSVSTQTLAAPAAGASLPVQVSAPAGCSWSSAETSPFVEISPAGPVSGSGVVTVTIAANPDAAARTATITAAGRAITITQPGAQSFACTASAPTVPQIRSEGAAELTSDVLLRCSGNAEAAIQGDVVVRLNTSLTSKLLSSSGEVDAVLLVNDPGALIPGSNVFPGRLAGGNAVRFSGIPVANAGANSQRTLRITNLRADATAPGLPQDITATVEIQAEAGAVSVASPQQTVARRTRSVEATFGTPAGTTDITLPVTFREVTLDAFRIRVAQGQDPAAAGTLYPSESGYANSAILGPRAGFADTPTRLLARFRGIPTGVRVFAPAAPSPGSGARLVSFDPTGNGIGIVSGSEEEMPVANGETTVTWEITAANPASIEALTFPVVFRNATGAIVSQIAAASIAALGPLPVPATATSPQPVPRFPLPGTPRRQITLRVKGSLPAGFTPRSPLRRDPTGSRSFSLSVSASNDSAEPAPETVLRGNLSAGSQLGNACEAAGSSTCVPDNRDVVLEYPRLDPGQTVTAVLSATLRENAPLGNIVRLNLNGASDASNATDSVEACIQGIPDAVPQPPPTGSSGSFTVFACGPWTIAPSHPWMVFTPSSGTGTAVVNYTFLPNNTGSPRTGSFTFPGGQATFTQQPNGPGGTAPGFRFVPVAPCRVADTRNPNGAFGGPILSADSTRTFAIPQSACGIPANASAYSLNVTVVPSGPLFFLTLYPAGQSRPGASTLNAFEGQIVANAALIPAGANGSVTVYVTNPAHVILDINGYFAP